EGSRIPQALHANVDRVAGIEVGGPNRRGLSQAPVVVEPDAVPIVARRDVLERSDRHQGWADDISTARARPLKKQQKTYRCTIERQKPGSGSQIRFAVGDGSALVGRARSEGSRVDPSLDRETGIRGFEVRRSDRNLSRHRAVEAERLAHLTGPEAYSLEGGAVAPDHVGAVALGWPPGHDVRRRHGTPSRLNGRL